MQKNNAIREELELISPIVQKIGNQNPFDLPSAYFEKFPDQLMLRLREEVNEGFDSLKELNKNAPFSLPDGYFNTLADSILNRVHQLKADSPSSELQSLSPFLAGLEKRNPFTVPTGYFDELSPTVQRIVEANSAIESSEETLAELLTSLKTHNVFQVPAGYFEHLPGEILKKVEPETAKVVSLSFKQTALKYAAAASIVLMLGVSSWLLTRNTSPATIANNAIVTDLDSSFKAISDKDIENYVEHASPLIIDPYPVASEVKDIDMKEMLANVADEDLKNYVDKYGLSENYLTN
jgi:hypothetical protein